MSAQIVKLMYNDFVSDMLNGDWVLSEKARPCTLTHQNTGIVSTFPVKKGTVGTALEIKCPKHQVLTVCGLGHSGIDPKDFVKNPMLYSIPHFFSIRCKNNEGQELSLYTRLKIIKRDQENLPVWSRTEFYGDLSQTIGERFKQKHERYYFPDGIILHGDENLVLQVSEPEIDIEKIELVMKADLFYKRERI